MDEVSKGESLPGKEAWGLIYQEWKANAGGCPRGGVAGASVPWTLVSP